MDIKPERPDSPMHDPITTERHLSMLSASARIIIASKKIRKRTKREITAMIAMPTFHDSVSETAASVCPPMMLFSTRKPCRVKTFRALGRMEP